MIRGNYSNGKCLTPSRYLFETSPNRKLSDLQGRRKSLGVHMHLYTISRVYDPAIRQRIIYVRSKVVRFGIESEVNL